MEEKNIADEYKVRQDKLNKLKKEGYTPFKRNFKTTHFSSDIKEIDINDFRDKELVLKNPKDFCSIAGRVITIRNHGKIIFMDISDMKGSINSVKKSKDFLAIQSFLKSPFHIRNIHKNNFSVISYCYYPSCNRTKIFWVF